MSSTKGKKGGNFLCSLRYRNDLPDLPFDPKLLDYPFDPERHFRYRPTTLEKEEKEVMLVEPTLGIPLTLIDPLAYFCSHEQREAGLDMEDKILFDDHFKSDDKEELELSWVKQPEYLSIDVRQEVLYGAPAHWSTASAKEVKNSMILDDDRAVHIEAIEKTFEEAQEAPVHPTKPNLEPVEVYDLLPAIDYWPYPYRHIVFAQDPAPPKTFYDPELVKPEELCKHGIVAALSAEGEEFATFICPKLGEYDDMDAFQEREIEEQEYACAGEYSFTIDQKKTVFIHLGENGKGTYNYTASGMTLKKHPKKRGAGGYPDVIHLQETDFGPATKKMMAAKNAQIKAQELVEADDDFDNEEEDEEMDKDTDNLHDIFGSSGESDDDSG